MAIRPAAGRRGLSVSEFLALPETKPASELIDGEVVQKPVARLKHNRPIRNLIRILDQHPPAASGDWLTEQGINFPGNHRVPDLVWFAAGRLSGIESYPDFAPDLAVEVRSEGQSLRQQRERLQYLRDQGTTVTLLIDPETRSIEVHERGVESVALPGGTVALASLGGLTFEVASVFSE